MEQIEQLKAMRAEALQRLQLNPDYKLANSLEALIDDLEDFLAPAADELSEPAEGEEDEEPDAGSFEMASLEDTGEAASDDYVVEEEAAEEVEEEAAEEDDESSLNDTIPPDSDASAALEALEAELAQAADDEN